MKQGTFTLSSCVCVQVFSAAQSARVGGTTSRVQSARLASVPASQRSGSVTGTTTVGTTATRMDAVSLPLLSFAFLKLRKYCDSSIYLFFLVRPTLVSHLVLIFKCRAKSPNSVIYALSGVMLTPSLSSCHSTKLLITIAVILWLKTEIRWLHIMSVILRKPGSAVIPNCSPL